MVARCVREINRVDSAPVDPNLRALDSPDCGTPALTACITGGRFSLSGRTTIAGSFGDGSITPISGRPTPPCTSKVRYGVTGDLDLTGGGAAAFTAVLTHYQVQLFGTCVPYFATVTGTFGPSAT